VLLDKVDYSPARNSCIAELETTYYSQRTTLENESIRDLISGETLFSVKSTDEDFDAFRLYLSFRVWDYVMKNASEPVELEKEWALMESKSSPKSELPSGR